jgi:hypothetical protein
LSRCPRFFKAQRRDTLNFSRISFSAHIIAKYGAALFPFQAAAAVRALTWCRLLPRLAKVTKENRVSANARAINLVTTDDGVMNRLIQ